MKPPNDLWDKNLLEEEPFLSQFMIRNGLTQNRRGDNWIATLAKEVHDNESSRAAAVQWSSQYAFAPEGKTQTKNIDHASLGSVEIFVRFYWALYSDKEQAALDVVNRERRKRGFSFQFELSRRPQNSGCIRAGRASTQIQKEQEIASYEHSSQTSLSRGSRGKRAPRKPTTSVGRDAAGRTASGKSRKAADATSTDGGTMVTGATGRDKSSAQSGGSAQTAEFSSSGSLTHTPDADARDPWAAMTFPEEDKGVVVFRGDHDAVAFEVAHSQPQNDPPPCMTVAHDQASGDRTDSASSSPTVVCPSTPSDVSGTTAAEPPVGFGKGRGRRARRDGPTEPTRQRPPRAATNHGKLSQLAKDEFKYYSKAKRGLVDDLEDLAVPANGAQQSASAPPTRRAKRSRVRTASEDRDDPMLPPADHGEAERMSGPTSASIAVHPAAPEAARRIPRSKYARPKPRRGEKGNEKERERNIRGADSSVRPPKRHRGKDSEANPTGVSEGVPSHTEHRRKKPLAAHPDVRLSDDGHRGTPSAPSSALPTGRVTDPPTMAPSTSGDPATSVNGISNAPRVPSGSRKILKLPKRPARRRLTKQAPAPAPDSLGIPANLAEADRMVRNLATGALMELQNTVSVAGEWTPDPGVQDAPLHSDDDGDSEEEDIPLSQVASSRRTLQAQGSEAASSHVNDIGVAYIPPIPDAIFKSATAPPVGVRVPRSVPPSPPTVPKKPLTARPIIWAKSRQEVCESLDWFRSYQSGVYHSKELVKGYLLSAFSADRDIFARDGRLIISHGGGKAESLHNSKGRTKLQKASDQEEGDKSVRALLRTQQMGRPVVLIIDDRYALFPYDLSTKANCTYVVLGFYHIAHAWAERQPADNNYGFVVRYKFAFEWCDKQPAPWWIEQDGSSGLEACRIAAPLKLGNLSAQYSPCASCHKASPRVYEQGWMCLHPGCVAFWIMNGTSPPQDLTYSEAFLRASLECNHEAMEDIAPQTPVTEATDGVITSRRFTRGWHCKDCGRLSCRYKWQYWECQNCGATLQIIGMARSPKDLRAHKSLGFLTHKVAEDSGIQVSQLMPFRDEELHAYYHIYILPENRGRIYLILGTPRTNEVADEIFQEYQDQAGTGELQLRRWPLKRHQCRGELLTNYFSHNTGEPYQYVGGTADTVPFDVAPSAVVKARDLIQSRMMSIMQAENQPYRFNEVLSAAYMEEQSMAFHSDAEDGLGPRVASLSLGSSAVMHFRPLKKYRKDTGGGMKCNALTLQLHHGDVLIMDGAQIQEYYEHTVVPHNFRIAATARYIDNRSH